VIFFVDASSLLKRYNEERGTEVMAELFRRPEYVGAFFISDHIALEVLVRLAKLARMGGRAERQEYIRALAAYERDRSELNQVTVESAVISGAEAIAFQFSDSGAGTLDLIHLSSAMLVRQTLPEETLIFVVSDRKLLRLAERAGFHVFNPEKQGLGELPAPPLPF
jgi:predicted nucleic acid-binding protein